MVIKYQPKRINILVAMARKGLNQKELGVRAKVNKATISLFLNEKRNRSITPKTANKIAEALECDVLELFDYQIKEVNKMYEN
ncbi:DNA-binding transcriptional regulator, XRE family [Halolactibacillus halophilus]|uniref:DNA-binding transcriptional regulator, XRE family n=2 Tax=Halolactibacillus halophilus TaxID=306540 RepID=A0A1I5Q0V0_9BACI|nr:helix-turn-helix transcriptional regulator [Halolactibacillus halophilus]GEM01937.1 hypothetical protein HHA03_14690 [Halolactibacillus halophilus]SFP39974.1 DNA-binding transcriptional regulator, XRE family [Halolactibacillus halophilus]